MAFDPPTRNRRQRFVNDARRILEEEFTRQIQNGHGLDPTSGMVTPLESKDDFHKHTADFNSQLTHLKGRVRAAVITLSDQLRLKEGIEDLPALKLHTEIDIRIVVEDDTA